jgi:hypothetical protein
MISEPQKTEFLHQGFLHITEAFDPLIAHQCAAFVLEQIDNPDLDIDREAGYVHIKEAFPTPPFPNIWNGKIQRCVDALLGENDYHPITEWGWFPVSFPGHAPNEMVAPEVGWHIDGEHCQRLDDPEYAVICLCLFTDVDAWGGGTFIEVASHKQVIRYMAGAGPSGRGVLHEDINDYMHGRPLRGEVVEISGKAGDIVFMNPYAWHCRGHNYSDRIRVICNSRCVMRRRMNLESPRNLVEQSIAEVLTDCFRG